MQVSRIENMTRGWFIGNFLPSAYRTSDFEVGFLKYKAGEKWDAHYHKLSVEINLLVRGSMVIQGKTLNAGDIFVLERYEVSDPVYLTDCEIIVVKVPSSPSDKYMVET